MRKTSSRRSPKVPWSTAFATIELPNPDAVGELEIHLLYADEADRDRDWHRAGHWRRDPTKKWRAVHQLRYERTASGVHWIELAKRAYLPGRPGFEKDKNRIAVKVFDPPTREEFAVALTRAPKVWLAFTVMNRTDSRIIPIHHAYTLGRSHDFVPPVLF